MIDLSLSDWAVAWYRRYAVWSHLLRIMPFAVAGILCGYFIMGRIDDRQLQPLIGAVTLLMLGLQVWRSRRRADSDERLPTWS